MANKDTNFKQLIQDEYKKANAFLNWTFSGNQQVDESDKKSNEAKVKKQVEKLKDVLLACKSTSDLIGIVNGLQKTLKNGNLSETDDDKSKGKKKTQTQMIEELLENQKLQLNKIQELEKKLGENSAQLKKLKGSIFGKILKRLMKYGTLALLIAYGFSQLPTVVQNAMKAEITAIKDDCAIIKDTIDGNTKTINRIAQDQVKTAEDLAKKIEQNHEDIVKVIDATLNITGKFANMFLSSEQLAAKYKSQVAQLQADIKEWQNLKDKDDKAKLASEIENKIDGIDTDEEDSSITKLKLSLKAAWHDISLRLTKGAGGDKVDESDLAFERQVKLVSETTKRFKKFVTHLNESDNDNSKEAQLQTILYDIWDNVQKSIKNPEAAEKWYFENKEQIQKLCEDPAFPLRARQSLKKAFSCLKTAIEQQPTSEERKSFLKKHWLKILMLIFLIAIFLVGGAATHGFAVLNAGAIGSISNVQMLANFISGGWGFVWRAILGILSAVGIFKLVKWWLFK